jgi:ubiquilin
MVVVLATSAHGGPISQTPAGIVPTTVAGVGLPNLGRLADHGLADLGSLDSAGGMLDPNTVQQMLQNPHIQQMMQGLLSNPQFMNQVCLEPCLSLFASPDLWL